MVRLLSATPPAIPARTAPAATSGVFAFEATFETFSPACETFSPACAIGPFVDAERPLAADAEGRLLDLEERPLPADDVVRREVLAPPPFELVRFVLDEALDLDVPSLLVDLPALDPVLLEPPERLLLLLLPLLDREDLWGILPSLQLVVIL